MENETSISNSQPDPESVKFVQKRKRRVFWAGLIWVILMVKSALLTYGIYRFDAPVNPMWIWIPSILAAILLSYILLRNRE